ATPCGSTTAGLWSCWGPSRAPRSIPPCATRWLPWAASIAAPRAPPRCSAPDASNPRPGGHEQRFEMILEQIGRNGTGARGIALLGVERDGEETVDAGHAVRVGEGIEAIGEAPA